MTEKTRHYGKYRGVVLTNIDPMQMGRIQVQVPDVLGPTLSSWAMPCVPFAGIQSGVFVTPQIGAGVWVEFEQGDADYPIWVGGFWGSAAEVPALAPAGGIMLKHMTGAMISISEIGITISNGQGATIMLTGPTVTINGGALTVI